MLRRCHDSVAAQTHPCTHYMIADGHPNTEVENWNLVHLSLPEAHNNNGNTPRATGTERAIADGVDAIAYLDADNWFEPGHIAHLLEAHAKTRAPFVTSGRIIRGVDGTVLLPQGQTSDGADIADTSTMMFTKEAFASLQLWGSMPDELSANCDTFVFKGVQALGFAHWHTGQPTVNFTSRYALHYRAAGAPVPAEATAMQAKKASDDMIRRLGPKGLSHVLAGGRLEAWFAAGQSTPIALVVLAERSALTEDQLALVEDVQAGLKSETNIEVLLHYAPAADVDVATPPFASLNNIFALTFAVTDQDRAAAGQFAEKNGRAGTIYIRPYAPVGDPLSPQDYDTALDRRAWLILTESAEVKAQYLAACRYGNAHVEVCDPHDQASHIVSVAQTCMR